MVVCPWAATPPSGLARSAFRRRSSLRGEAPVRIDDPGGFGNPTQQARQTKTLTMLKYNNAISFVAMLDRDTARRFYADVPGVPLVSDEPFALVFDLNGRMLRVAKAEVLTPARHTVLGWEVEDIASKVAELRDRGVVFERYDGMTQDELGIWTSPSGARVAWFKDPDGNNLSLTEFSPGI